MSIGIWQIILVLVVVLVVFGAVVIPQQYTNPVSASIVPTILSNPFVAVPFVDVIVLFCFVEEYLQYD